MDRLPNDPMILYSAVNMLLRDNYGSLDELCDDMNVNRKDLENTTRNRISFGKNKVEKGLSRRAWESFFVSYIHRMCDEFRRIVFHERGGFLNREPLKRIQKSVIWKRNYLFIGNKVNEKSVYLQQELYRKKI